MNSGICIATLNLAIVVLRPWAVLRMVNRMICFIESRRMFSINLKVKTPMLTT